MIAATPAPVTYVSVHSHTHSLAHSAYLDCVHKSPACIRRASPVRRVCAELACRSWPAHTGTRPRASRPSRTQPSWLRTTALNSKSHVARGNNTCHIAGNVMYVQCATNSEYDRFLAVNSNNEMSRIECSRRPFLKLSTYRLGVRMAFVAPAHSRECPRCVRDSAE
jgi:hypothetical protein